MDIKPPAPRPRPINPSEPNTGPHQQVVSITPLNQPVAPVTPPPQPIEQNPAPNLKPKRNRAKKWLIALIVLVVILVSAVIAGWFWYQSLLSPVDAGDTDKQVVQIVEGTLPDEIATLLKEKDLIRNEAAFLLYARIQGVQNSLQAGTYRLAASETTPEIVNHLTKGNVDTFDITFIPGATLAENREVFIESGYSEEEIDTAFSKTYDSPLFAGKPAEADLEGYIYGETYKFGAGATVEGILEYIFELYYQNISDNNLEAQYSEQGLTLYQAITLASIVQRESGGDDKAQIAQVFYTRLEMGMELGSDVTYQYAADKAGVERDTNLDSPYNTRRYPGLPPGPIAVPGIDSLKAVGNPAPGDYVYFLSGDDNITYYARTLAEHEANIVNHCKVKCQII